MWLWGVSERVQMYIRGMCVQAYANAGEEVCVCNCGVFKCRYSCVGMQVEMCICGNVCTHECLGESVCLAVGAG